MGDVFFRASFFYQQKGTTAEKSEKRFCNLSGIWLQNRLYTVVCEASPLQGADRDAEIRCSGSYGLLCHFHFDSQLAAIVAAGWAYGVVDVPCTTVRTYGERGGYGRVMGATLEGTGLGLSSFRMCHGFLSFFCYEF